MNAELIRNGELCPACGEGRLASRVEQESVEYSGRLGEVPLHYSVCDHCGSELVGEAESLANKRAMIAFRKSVDRLLTGEQVRAFRNRFAMTQDFAAAIFGGGKVAFSRYEKDDITQSTAMDRLIRLCIRRPSNITALATELGIELPPDVKNAVARDPSTAQDYVSTAVRELKALSELKEARIPKSSANDQQFERYGARDKAPVPQNATAWLEAIAA